MRRVLLLSALVTTVASLSYYKPVNTPATRIRLLGPLKVANRSECQLACDCARENLYNCSSFTPPIPPSNCSAYFYEDGGCALLGESVHNKCTRNNTEYVLIPDPCGNVSCGNGRCAVYDGWQAYCKCDEGYQGLECEELITEISFKNRTCLNSSTELYNGNFYEINNVYNMSYEQCYDFMTSKGTTYFFVINTSVCAVPKPNKVPKWIQYSGENCNKKCNGKSDQFCGHYWTGWLVYPKKIVDPNSCNTSSCGNNGMCIRKKGGSSCLCKYGYGGVNCTSIA